MKKQLTPVILALLSISFTANSQDINFLQFGTTAISYNPAMTGIDKGLKITTADHLFNLQNLVKANTFYASADFGFRKIPVLSGIGLTYSYDNEGIGFIRNNIISLTAGLRFPFSDEFAIHAGVSASLIHKTLNWEDFVYSDELNNVYGDLYNSSFIPPDKEFKNIPDFGAGITFAYQSKKNSLKSITGLALDHLFEPDQSFISEGSAPLRLKFVLHSDLVINTNEKSTGHLKHRGFKDPLVINPFVLVINQNDEFEVQAECNIIKFNFLAGVGYKGLNENWGDRMWVSAAVFHLGYRVFLGNESYGRLKYSLAPSFTKNGTDYTHEISLLFDLKN